MIASGVVAESSNHAGAASVTGSGSERSCGAGLAGAALVANAIVRPTTSN
jgi:hypothetical protein